MSWKEISSVSTKMNSNLSREFFGMFGGNKEETNNEKVVVDDKNEIKTIGSSYNEKIDKYIAKVESLTSDTVESDHIAYFGFIHRGKSPGETFPLVSLIDSYNKLIHICVENYNKVKNTSTNLDNVKFKSLVPVMDHNYGNDDFSIVNGDLYEYPMLFSVDTISVGNKKYFTLYTEDDKEGVLDTELYTSPDLYKIDKSKVLSGLRETKKLIDQIEKFKFNTYVEEFKLPDETDLEDEADLGEVNQYRAKIQLYLLDTINIILSLATSCPFKG